MSLPTPSLSQFFSLGAVLVGYLLILRMVAPIFVRASLVTQVVLRLVVVPLCVELALGALRLATRLSFLPALARSHVQVFLVQPVLAATIVGRLLGTNMDSTQETVGLAIGTSVIEILMRITIPYRDRLYEAAIRRCSCCCPASVSGTHDDDEYTPTTAQRKQHQRRRLIAAQDLHAYYTYLLLDTAGEDIGILLSLPLSLLFRLPSRIGGQPIPADELVLRVVIQYIIEFFTDIAPALIFLALSVCAVGSRKHAEAAASVTSKLKPLETGETEGPVKLELELVEAGRGANAPGGLLLKLPKTESFSLSQQESDVAADPSVQHSSLSSVGRVGPSQPPVLLDDSPTPTPTPLVVPAMTTLELEGLASNRASRRTMCETQCCVRLCPCCSSCTLHPHDEDVLEHRQKLIQSNAAFVKRLSQGQVWIPLGMNGLRAAKGSWLEKLALTAEVAAVRLTAAWQERLDGWTVAFAMGTVSATILITRNFFTEDLRCALLDENGQWYFDFCDLPENVPVG